MKTCDCGHEHCCHAKTKKKIINTKNEFEHKFSFERTVCADPDCKKWISDRPC